MTGLGRNVITVGALNDGCNINRQSEEGPIEVSNGDVVPKSLVNNGKEEPAIFGNVPNPAANQTSVLFNLGKSGMAGEIVITNLYGNKIMSYKVKRGETKIDIDCSELADGIYFNSLIVDGKLIGTKKMVITK